MEESSEGKSSSAQTADVQAGGCERAKSDECELLGHKMCQECGVE